MIKTNENREFNGGPYGQGLPVSVPVSNLEAKKAEKVEIVKVITGL
jgi:hypothetical protein